MNTLSESATLRDFVHEALASPCIDGSVKRIAVGMARDMLTGRLDGRVGAFDYFRQLFSAADARIASLKAEMRRRADAENGNRDGGDTG